MIENPLIFKEVVEAVEKGDVRYDRALYHAAGKLKSCGDLQEAIKEFKSIMYREPQKRDIAEIIQWGYR